MTPLKSTAHAAVTCVFNEGFLGEAQCVLALNSAFNGKTLQRGMRMAEIIIMVSLPNMQDIYEERCRKKALLIIRDPYKPANLSCCLLARDIALSELRQPE